MQLHNISDLVVQRERTGHPYLEFLRVPSMSAGIYELAAGSEDPQEPHTEDEVYYVVKGRSAIQVGGANRVVSEGSIIYVPAGIEHRFFDIEEDLTLLVFFAPPEGASIP